MQNRTCLDHRDRLAAKSRRVIDNRRHFVVWVYFAEFGAKVVAFEDVINYRAIRNRGLLQHEGSFAQDFPAGLDPTPKESDRKSVVQGQSSSGSVGHGGRRIIKKKK